MKSEPVCNALGVLVDVDLSAPIPADDQQELSDLLDRHHLLLFRDQHLTTEDQARAVSYVGPVIEGPDTVISNVDPRGGSLMFGPLVFHQDLAYSEIPLHGISLYGKVVSPGSVPTMFANNRRAYLRLPPELRQRVEGRNALHVYGFGNTYARRNRVADLGDQCFTQEHPVVMKNPRSGDPMLFVSEMQTDSIVGETAEESERILTELKDLIYADDNVYEHEWREGDLLIWDNIALQHARPDVRTDSAERTFERVTFGDPRCWDYLDSQKYADLLSRQEAHPRGSV
jgi:taurine dioxygenase